MKNQRYQNKLKINYLQNSIAETEQINQEYIEKIGKELIEIEGLIEKLNDDKRWFSQFIYYIIFS